MNRVRRSLALAVVSTLIAVAGYVGAMRSSSDGVRGAHPTAIVHVSPLFRVPMGTQTHDKVVALTFDDGPDPRWTPAVLQTLRHYHARATFFLVGEHALAHPDLVAAEMKAHDEIGNHTLTHPDLALLNAKQVQAELQGGAAAIVKAGGPHTTLFRPPKGLSDRIVHRIADAEGYRTVFWSLTVERYVNHQDIHTAVARLLEQVRPGTIILAHDGGIPNRARTVAALPLLLEGLKAKGYRVVDVSELLRAARTH